MPEIPKTAEIQILAADELIPQLPLQVKGHAETFTDAELEEMARTYNHDYLRAPLTKDHAQEGPALGWVKKLVKRGKALFAEVYGLAEELVNDVREGRYGSISIEADLNFKKTGKPYLTAVSFLGAGNPACAGMQRPVLSEKGELLAFLAASGENILCSPSRKLTLEEVAYLPQAAFDFENFDLLETVQDEKETDYITRILSRFQDAVWKVQCSDRTDKADLIRKYTAQLQKAISKTEGAELREQNKGGVMPEPNEKLEIRLANLEADNKKLREEKEAEIKKLQADVELKEARVAEMERKLKAQDIAQALDKLQSEGKLTAAERKNGNLDAVLLNLPDTTVKLGDKEVTLRESMLVGYAARTPVVKLGSALGPEGDSAEPGKGIRPDVMPKHLNKKELASVDPQRAELASRAKEIQLREQKTNPNFSYSSALVLAEQENPQLIER